MGCGMPNFKIPCKPKILQLEFKKKRRGEKNRIFLFKHDADDSQKALESDSVESKLPGILHSTLSPYKGIFFLRVRLILGFFYSLALDVILTNIEEEEDSEEVLKKSLENEDKKNCRNG